MGFLPTWGRYWHDKIKDGKPLFTSANAEIYGEWLGKRYEDAGIVWILGGDRSIDNDEQKEIIRSMARGLRRGDHGKHLITLHPSGGGGSAKWFQDEDTIDFNLRQNGHGIDFTGHYDQTRVDYDRTPSNRSSTANRFTKAIRCRSTQNTSATRSPPMCADRSIGTCSAAPAAIPTATTPSGSFTTQNATVPVNNPLMLWTEAIDQPGASQMQFGRRLIESRPFLTRIPDDSVIVTDRVPTSVPGAGTRRFVATRDTDGTYAMVDAPVGRNLRCAWKKSRRKSKRMVVQSSQRRSNVHRQIPKHW